MLEKTIVIFATIFKYSFHFQPSIRVLCADFDARRMQYAFLRTKYVMDVMTVLTVVMKITVIVSKGNFAMTRNLNVSVIHRVSL